MIAERQMYHTAALGRLRLELHDEIHNLARIRTAIQQITGYNQVCCSTGPILLVVNNGRILQSPDHRIVCAMRVADGNDTFNIRPDKLLRKDCWCRQGSEQPYTDAYPERLFPLRASVPCCFHSRLREFLTDHDNCNRATTKNRMLK